MADFSWRTASACATILENKSPAWARAGAGAGAGFVFPVEAD